MLHKKQPVYVTKWQRTQSVGQKERQNSSSSLVCAVSLGLRFLSKASGVTGTPLIWSNEGSDTVFCGRPSWFDQRVRTFSGKTTTCCLQELSGTSLDTDRLNLNLWNTYFKESPTSYRELQWIRRFSVNYGFNYVFYGLRLCHFFEHS